MFCFILMWYCCLLADVCVLIRFSFDLFVRLCASPCVLFCFIPKAKYRTTEVQNHRKILDFSKLGLFLIVSIWFCSIFCGESESVHPRPTNIFGVKEKNRFRFFWKKYSLTPKFFGPLGIRIRILRKKCCRIIWTFWKKSILKNPKIYGDSVLRWFYISLWVWLLLLFVCLIVFVLFLVVFLCLVCLPFLCVSVVFACLLFVYASFKAYFGVVKASPFCVFVSVCLFPFLGSIVLTFFCLFMVSLLCVVFCLYCFVCLFACLLSVFVICVSFVCLRSCVCLFVCACVCYCY